MPSDEKLFNVIIGYSVAALVVSCVDVDGYHMRNDAYPTGGAPQVLPTTGGLSSVLTGGRAAFGGSSSQGGAEATGGSVALVWQCVSASFHDCASASTSSECGRLPGCQYGKVPSCTIVYANSCTNMSDSIDKCASLAGCTSTGDGSCGANDLTGACRDYTSDECGLALQCLDVENPTLCQALSSCHWTSYYGSCTGTPTPCSSFATSTRCSTSSNCAWTLTDACVGTPTDCVTFTTETTCNDSLNCSWKGIPANTGGTASTVTSSATGIAGMIGSGGLQDAGGS